MADGKSQEVHNHYHGAQRAALEQLHAQLLAEIESLAGQIESLTLRHSRLAEQQCALQTEIRSLAGQHDAESNKHRVSLEAVEAQLRAELAQSADEHQGPRLGLALEAQLRGELVKDLHARASRYKEAQLRGELAQTAGERRSRRRQAALETMDAQPKKKIKKTQTMATALNISGSANFRSNAL